MLLRYHTNSTLDQYGRTEVAGLWPQNFTGCTIAAIIGLHIRITVCKTEVSDIFF